VVLIATHAVGWIQKGEVSVNIMNILPPPCSSLLGQSFVCVDDQFDSIPKGYERLPQKGDCYTLIEIYPEIRPDSSGRIQFAGNFAELPPGLSCTGFYLRRFRPVDPVLAESDYATAAFDSGVYLLRSCLGPVTRHSEGETLVGFHQQPDGKPPVYVYSMIRHYYRVAVTQNNDTLRGAVVERLGNGEHIVLASIERPVGGSLWDAAAVLLLKLEQQSEVMIREVVVREDNSPELRSALMAVPVILRLVASGQDCPVEVACVSWEPKSQREA
jgi:hypothetical protein